MQLASLTIRPLGHTALPVCRWLYATTKRTDWKFVVVSNLLARAEVSFGVNNDLRLVRNLNDLSIAIWFAAVVDEARQIALRPWHRERLVYVVRDHHSGLTATKS